MASYVRRDSEIPFVAYAYVMLALVLSVLLPELRPSSRRRIGGGDDRGVECRSSLVVSRERERGRESVTGMKGSDVYLYSDGVACIDGDMVVNFSLF